MAGPSPYVLVVDDSTDGREMLVEYLQYLGLTVVAVDGGDAALRQAFASPPALTLMDLQMPGITGWEATRQLKSHPKTKDGIVVALTAHALAPDAGKALEAGCDAFVPKPYDIAALGEAVVTVVRRGRAGLKAFDRPQGFRLSKRPRK